MATIETLGILVALSVLPPLLFLVWIRNREQNDREPVRAVLAAFAYGGSLGVVVALLLSVLFDANRAWFANGFGIDATLLSLVVAAPFIEELSKGFGLSLSRKRIHELEDGFVYGAALGLGFAATENILYGVTSYFEGGAGLAYQTLIVRAVSSTLLHAGASALLGFGYALIVVRGDSAGRLLPFYLVAVGLHALYNFLVFTETFAGLAAAVIIVWVVLLWVRRRIGHLDALPHGDA